MSTPLPLLADALGLLDQDLYTHLDGAENLADQRAGWSAEDMATARELIGDLVLVLRGLLIEHRMQPSGDCRVCTGAWPCPVVSTIHAVVKDP
ncbi:MAG TPA: hypothetical protein VN327_03480, partial [Pseudonocardiaceae bacterium]|nr:hypothetical protein [Pseudonocardiaceae bacterium]